MTTEIDGHWAVAVTLLPVGLNLLVALCFLADIPRGDDFDIFLGYLSASPDDRLDALLFAQHNEHRPAYSRALGELLYRAFGRIDFRVLALIGNLALVLLLVALYKRFRAARHPLALFLPVPYFLFSTPHFENTTWATGALQNYSVLLFAFLSLTAFEKERHGAFALSLGLAALASLTSGSGLLLFPVLVWWAALRVRQASAVPSAGNGALLGPRRSRTLTLLAIVAASCIFVALYLKHYIRPAHHPLALESLTHPLHSALYLLAFLGSYAWSLPISVAVGAAILFLIVKVLRRGPTPSSGTFYFFLVFLTLNAVAATLTRSGFGLWQALSSRYVIVSACILACVYLLSVEGQPWLRRVLTERRKSVAAALVVLGLTMAAYQTLYLARLEKRLHEGLARHLASGVGLDYPDQIKAIKLIESAAEQDIYRLPTENAPAAGDQGDSPSRAR